ncbi:Pr6Pr family membrane protein [Agromyces silvae]|uniref:Pr6Pr family membrane protein n=1 Tax=Agromyces silvae TaxID=3388266 RepID=UPI00280BF1BD|nr:Pr6Pr family membrane protein [Agromyces protaetiae]
MHQITGVLRIAVAALIVAAIVGQFAVSWSLVEDRAFFLVNFFSYFTILSNALAALTLLTAAWFAFTRPVEPSWFTVVRVCAATYMATTLVVYNLLLRGISLDQATTVPWSNEILHVWGPLLVVLDWILAPGRTRVPWSRYLLIAVVPIVWVVYSLTRGPIVGWYPYPFLNPAQPGGYGAVALYVIAIAAFILIVGAGLVALSRLRTPGQPARPRSSPAAPNADTDPGRPGSLVG